MRREAAILALKGFEPRLRALGATSAYLFGSTARESARPDSDVDVLLDVRSDVSFTLLDLAAARRLLSEGLAATVDVTTVADLNPKVGRNILAEAIRVF